ncbi:class I fructose-bisphosphate aldolase [Nocardioides aquiterrae]|uniref:fructose-bisphosphate aldolase n=1 Tax=Nocardioides aquiterrae TaxID=203799 RepID=A0ABP4EWB8_9ACTN
MTIEETIATILSPAKGMLVIDEHAEALVGGRGDREPAHRFTELVLSTPELAGHVSSVLLTRHTFDAVAGRLPADRLVGVRLDTRSDPATGFSDLVRTSASFVEWRAHVPPHEVSRGAVHIQAGILARGAAAAQSEGIVPVLTVAMPDLTQATIRLSQAVTSNALVALREELDQAGADASRLLLRVNMVVAGEADPEPHDPQQVAALTLLVLERCLPGTAGVLLLSGGQPLDRACANLRAISALAARRARPWPVTFSFCRPLVRDAAQAFSNGDTAEAARLVVESARRASESLEPARVSDDTVA